jgi:hypothetical protein
LVDELFELVRLLRCQRAARCPEFGAYPTDARRAVACFLYQASPQLERAHLERVMGAGVPIPK